MRYEFTACFLVQRDFYESFRYNSCCESNIYTLLMMNAALSNEDIAALFPWSAVYMVATNSIEQTGYPMEAAIAVIAITSILGMLLSFWYFGKNDIK